MHYPILRIELEITKNPGYNLQLIPSSGSNAIETSHLLSSYIVSNHPWLNSYERFDSFDPTKASFSTWLYVVIRNKLKNYYRDSKGLDELDENIADNTLMEDEVISAIRLSQLRNQLADALMTLNDLQRQVVVLKYFSDLHSKEIAARLGISPENVRVILSRSIAKLSKIMRLPENEME